MISNEKIERIAYIVIKTLHSRFLKYPSEDEINRNAPFHEAFLNAFKDKFAKISDNAPFIISISSWMQGLNTTLGMSFFESVAHILSDGEKKEYTEKSGLLDIPIIAKDKINSLITELSGGTCKPSLTNENAMIQSVVNEKALTKAIGFSADVFYFYGDIIIAIEMKTVRPNSGQMQSEKQKILEGKAALQVKYGKKVDFYLGFPFDPYFAGESTGYDKSSFMKGNVNMVKYIDPNEILIANELWDFLSNDSGTMNQILSIINSIATPSFMDDYNYLNDNGNRNLANEKYTRLLEKWHLTTDLELLKKDREISSKITHKSTEEKIYNHSLFKNDSSYNFERQSTLLKLLHNQ